MTDDDFEDYLTIKSKLKDNKNKIESINNKSSLINYYLDNASILTTYYTSKKKIANNEVINNN